MKKYTVLRNDMELGTFTAEEILLRLNMRLLKGDEMARDESQRTIPLTQLMREHARRP